MTDDSPIIESLAWALFACFVVAVVLLGLACFAVYVVWNLPMNVWRVLRG